MELINDGGTLYIQLSFHDRQDSCWRVTNIEISDKGFIQKSYVIDQQAYKFNKIFRTLNGRAMLADGEEESRHKTLIKYSYVFPRQGEEYVSSIDQGLTLGYIGNFNEFVWAINRDASLLVVATGDDMYGFKKCHREKPPKYMMEIVKYNPVIETLGRIYLNNILSNERVDKMFFNAQENAILLCTSQSSFVWCALHSKTFSNVMKWEMEEIKSRHYCYHWKYGDTFVVITETDEIFFVFMKNFEFCEPLRYHLNLKGNVKATHYELFTDKLGRHSLLRCTYFTIDIYDLLSGRYRTSINLPRKVERNNWISNRKKGYKLCAGELGNEIFLLQTIECHHTVYVYYIEGFDVTLVDLAKKVVFNTYPAEQIHDLGLPKLLIPGN